jgi:hypothetical protein
MALSRLARPKLLTPIWRIFPVFRDWDKLMPSVRVRKTGVGRIPNQPDTEVPIPKRAVAKFKPGKEMGEAVLKLSPPVNLKTAVEKAGQSCITLILLGDATSNCSHRTSPAG